MRTIKDFNEVKDMDYLQFVQYLLNKYGAVEADYFRTVDCNSKTPSKNGWDRHHIYENKIANLCSEEIAKTNDFEYQLAKNLVYCPTPADHIFLHILIAKETPIAELGRNGAKVLLEQHEKSIDPYLYQALLNELIKTGTLLEHNINLYNDVKFQLTLYKKALCTLATGGGKTTTALQYIVENNLRTLVLAPKKSITDDWENRKKYYPQICKVMCYQSFVKANLAEVLQDIDFIILDEVHHLSNKGTWITNVEEAMKLVPTLGITAENKRSDNQRVADILFDGRVCKGKTTAEFLMDGTFWPISYVSTLLTNPHLSMKPECAFLQRELDLAANMSSAADIIKKYRPDYTKVKGIVFIPRNDGMTDGFQQAKDILVTAYGPSVLDYISEINYKLGAKACKNIKDDFEKAKFGFIIAIDMISEGIHFSGINTEIILRNAHSPLVVNQQIGRLTRIKHVGEADPNCILFDLVNIIKTVDYRDQVQRISRGEVGRAIRELSGKSSAVIFADECDKLYNVLERAAAFKQESLFDELCEL